MQVRRMGAVQGKKSNLGSLMMVAVDKNTFSLVGDIPSLLERAAGTTIQPTSDDKAVTDVLTARNAQVRQFASCRIYLLNLRTWYQRSDVYNRRELDRASFQMAAAPSLSQQQSSALLACLMQQLAVTDFTLAAECR